MEEQLENKNLDITELIDLAYEIARETFGKESFSFQSIWSKTWKSANKFNKGKVEDWIGHFYTELLLDPRFVIFNFQTWRLKEYMTFSEMKKLDREIFDKQVDIEDVLSEELESGEEGEVVEISGEDDLGEDKSDEESSSDREDSESDDYNQLDSD